MKIATSNAERVSVSIAIGALLLVATAIGTPEPSLPIGWQQKLPHQLLSVKNNSVVLLSGNWTMTTSISATTKRLKTIRFCERAQKLGFDSYLVDVTREASHKASLEWLGSQAPIGRPLLVIVGSSGNREFVMSRAGDIDLGALAMHRLEKRFSTQSNQTNQFN